MVIFEEEFASVRRYDTSASYKFTFPFDSVIVERRGDFTPRFLL